MRLNAQGIPVKPYHAVAIADSGEPLVPIPKEALALVSPHPYMAVGAPYGDKSPFFLRQGVLMRLLAAQAELQRHQPDWRILVFDAYRPVAVQRYMVDHTFQEVLAARNLTLSQLTAADRQELMTLVLEFWAEPSPDPATPPPHSTGAAIDVTLVDATGQEVDMGSPIDELSPRSHPNYFATSPDASEQIYHRHRQLLHDCMAAAGFIRHPGEWWHFSYGDQMWAWLKRQGASNPVSTLCACYGRVD